MKHLLIVIVLLVLFVAIGSVHAQDGITVTVPPTDGGGGAIPPVTWDPDNWILIISVGFIIAFSVLGGVVVFLGNKLYLSIPQWAQPGAENIVREGVQDALAAGQAIVLRTPTPLDDHMLQIIEKSINEKLAEIFTPKG